MSKKSKNAQNKLANRLEFASLKLLYNGNNNERISNKD